MKSDLITHLIYTSVSICLLIITLTLLAGSRQVAISNWIDNYQTLIIGIFTIITAAITAYIIYRNHKEHRYAEKIAALMQMRHLASDINDYVNQLLYWYYELMPVEENDINERSNLYDKGYKYKISKRCEYNEALCKPPKFHPSVITQLQSIAIAYAGDDKKINFLKELSGSLQILKSRARTAYRIISSNHVATIEEPYLPQYKNLQEEMILMIKVLAMVKPLFNEADRGTYREEHKRRLMFETDVAEDWSVTKDDEINVAKGLLFHIKKPQRDLYFLRNRVEEWKEEDLKNK